MAATPITDEQFLEAWVTNGYNSKKAYKSLRPDVTPDSAKELGKRKLASCKASGVYQSLLDKAYQNVIDLMSSDNEETKRKQTKDLLEWVNGKAQVRIDHTTLGEKLPQPLLGGQSNGIPSNDSDKETTETE